jgi:predicted transcriptional regulator
MRPPVASNPSRRRNHLQLIAEILENAKTGRTKTFIMWKVGMNHHQVNEYLEFLNRKGFIKSNKGVFQTTSKGLIFVKDYKTLLSVLLAPTMPI